jgi:hypothetical protein
MQVIKGRLYVGSRAQAQNWSLLQSLGITHIFNVSRDSKEPFEGMLLTKIYLLFRCSPICVALEDVILDFLVVASGVLKNQKSSEREIATRHVLRFVAMVA